MDQVHAALISIDENWSLENIYRMSIIISINDKGYIERPI